MDTPPQPESQPSNPNPGRFKLAKIVIGSTVLLLIIIGLLLPTLNTPRRQARSMRCTTQVRGIVQGLVTYAGGNKAYMPGNDSRGHLIPDVDGDEPFMPATRHGGTIEGRFWLMLNSNLFSGDYIITPAETKTLWTTGEVNSDNYSYAMLNIHSDGRALDTNHKTRPNQTGRADVWTNASTNPNAALVANRARIPGAKIANNYDKIYSVHSSEEDAYWAGNVGFGDGSAVFAITNRFDTQYGDGPQIKADRLFSLDQDTTPKTDYDKLTDPHATWDKAANALLGYKSVGYQDPDIASD